MSIYTTVINAKIFINERKIMRLKDIDPLTDLGNKYSYDEYINELEKVENIDGITVFILDIDGLKLINDTKGHLVGDKIIKGAAKCITSIFSSRGKCFRIGGDEFCVIVEKYLSDPNEILGQFKGSILEWSEMHGNILSISCGYASSVEVSKRIVIELVKEADEKMYADKRSKKIFE